MAHGFLGKNVFPIPLFYPLEHSLELTNLIAPFGDGYEQRVTKNLLWLTYTIGAESPPRADGLGNADQAYRGINKFTITARNLKYINSLRSAILDTLTSTTTPMGQLWKFYQDQDGNLTSFWFYNPAERHDQTNIIDFTGTSTKGRYLVRFMDSAMSSSLFVRNLHNFGITLVETRD